MFVTRPILVGQGADTSGPKAEKDSAYQRF